MDSWHTSTDTERILYTKGINTRNNLFYMGTISETSEFKALFWFSPKRLFQLNVTE